MLSALEVRIALAGDWLRGKEGAFEQEARYWVAENRARVDAEDRSDILDLERGVLLIIFHDRRLVQEASLPVRLERYLHEVQVIQALKRLMREYDPEVEVKRSTPGDPSAPPGTVVYETRIGNAQSLVRGRLTSWVDPAVDERLGGELIRTLERNRYASMPMTANWMYEAFWPPDGFAVRAEVDFEVNGLRNRYLRTLESVREVEVPRDHFEAPAAYEHRELGIVHEVEPKPLPHN